MLESLDLAVLGFIRDPKNSEAFERVLAGYVFILQNAVIRLIKESDEN